MEKKILRSQERVRNSHGQWAISAQATEVLLYNEWIIYTFRWSFYYFSFFLPPFSKGVISLSVFEMSGTHSIYTSKYNTVNPLYNDIHYNSKICYNVNSVCTKNSGLCIFSSTVPWYSLRKHMFWICFGGNSIKYTKCMICKKLFKRILYSCFRRVHIKFLYKSKLDFTAKSLVTNAVVIKRVLCTPLF